MSIPGLFIHKLGVTWALYIYCLCD